MDKSNFWTAGTFVINSCQCIGVDSKSIQFRVSCMKNDKPCTREVTVPFPVTIDSDDLLKSVLVTMAKLFNCVDESKDIIELPFGQSYQLPRDFKFNEVPHSQWLRSYIYDSVKSAVIKAIFDKNFPYKSKMQVKFNFPEVNPAFDTYRVGTVLECVRHVVLALTVEERLRVRICVQQSLGEGVFTGLPLALASMRPILERMDWGSGLSESEKFCPADFALSKGVSRPESLVRLGEISGSDVAEDDDVIIVIAPQNVIGGMVIELLGELVESASTLGGRQRPVLLLNPSLGDRPSSNNVMQIRGRAERREFENSFTDIYEMRLLYPSSGGYMFPIRGLVLKKDHESPWVIYSKASFSDDNEGDEGGSGSDRRELYEPLAALPPAPTPSRTEISELFTR